VRRRFRNYVLSKTKKNFVDLDGQRMHVDPSEYLKLVIADYRGLHTKYLKQNIKPGDVVIDVGANIGYFTCLLSKLVGKSGHVYSFEPELNNFKMLKMNVEENNCSNVTIEQKAVSDKSGIVKLNMSESSTAHSIYEKFDDGRTIDVETISFDDYFGKKTIDYIKSNAQGADYPMFLGMPNLLEYSKKLSVWLEFDPFLIREQGSTPEIFLEFLKNNNFEVKVVRDYFKKPKKIDNILEYVKKHNGCSLLCTRS
jgi:FkbM family methyltransferase